jgi:hypothetical protein
MRGQLLTVEDTKFMNLKYESEKVKWLWINKRRRDMTRLKMKCDKRNA